MVVTSRSGSRNGAKEDRIHNGENDDVGAQTSAKREHGNGSETGNLDQFAARVFQVVHAGNSNSECVIVISGTLRSAEGTGARPSGRFSVRNFRCVFRNPNAEWDATEAA
jgi:hypothetical protein